MVPTEANLSIKLEFLGATVINYSMQIRAVIPAGYPTNRE